MNRPAIVIRDIHHYGDDLTVPEAIARLCDGGQVTVTVTDPAPPGGDPRGNPRHGFDITVRPALGGQPELPPEVSWEARTFETPDSAALFAEALALASQLAACAGLGGGQAAPARRRPSGPPTGGTPPGAPSPSPRPPPAATSPPGWRPATRWPATCTTRPRWAASTASATTPRTWPATSASSWTATSTPPWPTTASCDGRGGVLHRRRRSLLGRGRTHRPRPRRPAPRHQQPARRGMKPPAGRKPGHPGPHREN